MKMKDDTQYIISQWTPTGKMRYFKKNSSLKDVHNKSKRWRIDLQMQEKRTYATKLEGGAGGVGGIGDTSTMNSKQYLDNASGSFSIKEEYRWVDVPTEEE